MRNLKFKIKNEYDTSTAAGHSRADGNLKVSLGKTIDTKQPTQFLIFNFSS
ncbi:MAG: hypothetical protein ISP74_03760 [Bacteroidia bacterium]|nr:hypothetical protein [Bacteroidia bacterium]